MNITHVTRTYAHNTYQTYNNTKSDIFPSNVKKGVEHKNFVMATEKLNSRDVNNGRDG